MSKRSKADVVDISLESLTISKSISAKNDFEREAIHVMSAIRSRADGNAVEIPQMRLVDHDDVKAWKAYDVAAGTARSIPPGPDVIRHVRRSLDALGSEYQESSAEVMRHIERQLPASVDRALSSGADLQDPDVLADLLVEYIEESGGRWVTDTSRSIIYTYDANTGVYCSIPHRKTIGAVQAVLASFLRSLDHAHPQARNGVYATRSISSDIVGLMIDRLRIVDSKAANKWLVEGTGEADEIICIRSGLFDLKSMVLRPWTRDFFTVQSRSYDYRPGSTCPAFLKVLGDAFPEGHEDSIEALQEYAGYTLTSHVKAEKMLFLYGSPGSGKGCILEGLQSLHSKVASLKTSATGSQFGLSELAESQLGVFGDARESGKTQQRLLEMLLSIASGDVERIEAKNKDSWSQRISAKLIYVSNDALTIADDSMALNRRSLVIETQESPNAEDVDTSLKAKIRAEADGIFLWALDGLKRLRERNWKFIDPRSGEEKRAEMREAANLVALFAQEYLDYATDETLCRIRTQDLYEMFQEFQKNHGNTERMDLRAFSRKLAAVKFPNGRRLKRKTFRFGEIVSNGFIVKVVKQPDGYQSHFMRFGNRFSG